MSTGSSQVGAALSPFKYISYHYTFPGFPFILINCFNVHCTWKEGSNWILDYMHFLGLVMKEVKNNFFQISYITVFYNSLQYYKRKSLKIDNKRVIFILFNDFVWFYFKVQNEHIFRLQIILQVKWYSHMQCISTATLPKKYLYKRKME